MGGALLANPDNLDSFEIPDAYIRTLKAQDSLKFDSDPGAHCNSGQFEVDVRMSELVY